MVPRLNDSDPSHAFPDLENPLATVARQKSEIDGVLEDLNLSEEFDKRLKTWASLGILPNEYHLGSAPEVKIVEMWQKLSRAHRFECDLEPQAVAIKSWLDAVFKTTLDNRSAASVAVWHINVYDRIARCLDQRERISKTAETSLKPLSEKAVIDVGYQEWGRFNLYQQEVRVNYTAERNALLQDKPLDQLTVLTTGEKKPGTDSWKKRPKSDLARFNYFACEAIATDQHLEQKTLAALGQYLCEHDFKRPPTIRNLIEEDGKTDVTTNTNILFERIALQQLWAIAFPDVLQRLEKVFADSAQNFPQQYTPQQLADTKIYFQSRVAVDFISMANLSSEIRQEAFRILGIKHERTTENHIEILFAHAALSHVLDLKVPTRDAKKLENADIWVDLLQQFKLNEILGWKRLTYFFQHLEQLGQPRPDINNRRRVVAGQWSRTAKMTLDRVSWSDK